MRVNLATLLENLTAAENEPTDHAAFHALTPVQRDSIASTVTPISALMAAVNRGLAPIAACVAAVEKPFQPLIGALAAIGEAEELERQVLAATPRDRLPKVRCRFQSLQSLSVGKVKATLVAMLRHALQRMQSRVRRSSSATRTTTSRRTQTSATPAAEPSPSSPSSLGANALGALRTETPRRWSKRALIGGTAS